VRELRNLMERLALFLAAEPLQALTPALIQRVAPELAGMAGMAQRCCRARQKWWHRMR
jgi:propionate catabolism operon transcriptional regulator